MLDILLSDGELLLVQKGVEMGKLFWRRQRRTISLVVNENNDIPEYVEKEAKFFKIISLPISDSHEKVQ